MPFKYRRCAAINSAAAIGQRLSNVTNKAGHVRGCGALFNLMHVAMLLVQLSERKGLISLQPPIQGILRRVPRDNGVKTFTRLY
jgi:hypothetical protein